MVYLGSKMYGSEIYMSHELYYDGIFYSVVVNIADNIIQYYILKDNTSYEETSPFIYKIPETLNMICYKSFNERMKCLKKICDLKIYDIFGD